MNGCEGSIGETSESIMYAGSVCPSSIETAIRHGDNLALSRVGDFDILDDGGARAKNNTSFAVM